MKLAKMTQNLLRKLKITDFLLDFGFCSKRLFVGIGVLHECTDFYTCMCNAARGAHRGMSKGGAVEPFCHAHFWKHISDVNFHQFWGVCKVSWLFEHV